MQNLRNKSESERVRQKYRFDERRKKLMSDKNKNIISATMANFNQRENEKSLARSDYEEFEIENSEKVKELLETDRKLLEELEIADQRLNGEIIAENISEMEKFDNEAIRNIEEIEVEFGKRRLEISKKGENVDELLANLENEQNEAILSTRRENLRQRAKLEALLKARRRVKLNENTDKNTEKLKNQENKNFGELEDARKTVRKKQEIVAIKNELGQNEKKDAIKIVKSVLDARHKEELAKLEDR